MSTTSSSSTSNKFKVAACQLFITGKKETDVANALAKVKEAAEAGAKLVVLPECFNCPYSTSVFKEYGEKDGGPTTTALSKIAAEKSIFLVGGSIPEISSEGKVFNTSYTYGPDGSLLAKHRKVHLFDIDVPGKITFRESETLSPGSTFSSFQTPWLTVGLGICYDIRFPEYAQLLRSAGSKLLIYPGAFNTTTGPKHWELLQRARAVDNQCYVITCSPARDPNFSYQAWGHSSIIDPWGEVIATTDEKPSIIYAEIDPASADDVRTSIPVFNQRRDDMYSLQQVKK